MPMDPYFEDQLRENRRGTIAGVRTRIVSALRAAPGTALAALAALPGRIRAGRRTAAPATVAEPSSLAAPVLPAPAEPAPASPTPATPPPTRTWSEIPPITALEAFTTAKAHRVDRYSPAGEQRNALLWDRKLHGRVGLDGPELTTREFVIPTSGFPDVRVRLYLPDTPAPTGGFPAVLAFFGGAFHVGGIDYTSVDAGYRRRTRDSGVAHVAVDYALAPIHRFPTPVEQGYAALDWLVAHAPELGLDPARLGITGTSSGGNIAAALTILNRERAHHPLRLQLLEVPSLDLTGKHVDFAPLREMRVPRLLLARELRRIRGRYLAHPDQARTALASPLLAPDLAGLPPAHILTAEYDTLRGDGAAYARALRLAGVPASAIQFGGATHDAIMYTAAVPLAEHWHLHAVAILRTL
ncbi:alpha/beta hydrolase [Mycetocola tolaasinivorans]|uniref:Alpha/beta hydrolase n=1 Tax=Mycetocola tolaasinivorans TaxID=76635 RepID=A0A3L7A2U0_9MICO|nr:alpha/beta hydrolase fold domain-containing protein [Mycetocola tolaasinivorans]RLP74559.1 alpha/beta hydrolase [Mycetocola tolaasinivorans]